MHKRNAAGKAFFRMELLEMTDEVLFNILLKFPWYNHDTCVRW